MSDRQIIDTKKICVTYSSPPDIEPRCLKISNTIITNQKQQVKKKDSENPRSEYHDWLEKNTKVISREKIIKRLENQIKDPKNSVSISRFESSCTPTDDGDSCDTSANEVVFSEAKKSITLEEESDVFNLFACFRWRDRDEGKIMTSLMKKEYLETLIQEVYSTRYLMNKLYAEISSKTRILDGFNEEEKNNFLLHVIAKGKDFYYSSIKDVEFLMYLVDQYQPIWSKIKEVYNVAI